jgi:hypothetical protein
MIQLRLKTSLMRSRRPAYCGGWPGSVRPAVGVTGRRLAGLLPEVEGRVACEGQVVADVLASIDWAGVWR